MFSENCSLEEFTAVVRDITNTLRTYLKKVESEFDFSKLGNENAIEWFCNPDIGLNQRNQIAHKVDLRNVGLVNLSILSFNYTSTVQKLLNISRLPNYNFGSLQKKPICLGHFYHIHNRINELVLGVDNEAQIKNPKLRGNVEMMNLIVKPRINEYVGDANDVHSRTVINNATRIYIFGCSIGDSDQTWWRLIGERLVKGAKLFIFAFDEKGFANDRHQVDQINMETSYKQRFMRLAEINSDDLDSVRKNIVVTVNSNVFGNIKPVTKHTVEEVL